MQTRQQTTFSFDVRSVTLFAALALGSATALMAQTGAPPAKAATHSTDLVLGGPTNTPAPTASTPAAVFDRLDKDKNGQLSAVEARQLPAISERFKEADSDGNGLLSRAEFEKAVQR